MTFPDCRYDKDYNENYLNADDKHRLAGYDYCVKEVYTAFLNDLCNLIGKGSYLQVALEKEVPEDLKKTLEYEFETGKIEKIKIETFLDLITTNVLIWLESSRDEMITSFIDYMKEEDYRKNKENYLKEKEKNKNE